MRRAARRITAKRLHGQRVDHQEQCVTYKVWSVSPHGLVLWCISVVSESHDMTLFSPISSPIPEYFSGLTLSSQSSQGFYFLHIKREPLSQVFCLFVPSGA